MIQNIKVLIIVAALVATILLVKDWQFQKREIKIQKENVEQLLRVRDSNYSQIKLNRDQINQYIDSNEELMAIIKKFGIKHSRVEKIIETKYVYKDDKQTIKDITPVVDKIKKNISFSIPIVDSTDCLLIKGSIDFVNDSLSYKITSRIFNNKTSTISYWERKQWKFLFIKSRLFGKIQVRTIINDKCGKSDTQIIEINKNK